MCDPWDSQGDEKMQQLLSSTFATRSVYLLSGAVSMKDMLFIDDFILIWVIQ